MLRGLPLLIAVLLAAAKAGPCDIYKAGGTPCVAAHSTVRALFEDYARGLYQVTRASDQKKMDILPLTTYQGFANAAAQDAFCKGTQCHITIIYDQSGNNNHLTPAPGGAMKPQSDDPALADQLSIMINGYKVYGVSVAPGIGYRNNNTTGVAKADQAEAMYMVADATNVNSGCCFDYGNAETTNKADGLGTMETLYLGKCENWTKGQGRGPWVLADLEAGLYGCGQGNVCPNPSINYRFVVAMLKGRSGGTFALKQGNAQSGKLLTTYDGPRPKGYEVMKKQGAIVLGIGGDNSNEAVGSFFEGAIVTGNPADAVDDEIQMDILKAGYGLSVPNHRVA
ncbi:hypothetical protein PsorP6_015987 [Peronosclerospora sorghi]|uniref:Uncharacterized protein n=1 Tax=Peronosclerospora sorghi TaxID=230839 RepID=A0ACC0WN18_9STRA|nr:hypothetical protein PsorP6_015987 [Peronosclerospora sorghi]